MIVNGMVSSEIISSSLGGRGLGELHSIRLGCEMAKSLGISSVSIESNNKQVIA